MYKTNKKLLNNKNALEILELIKNTGGISRADLAKEVKLTPASITKITKKLIEGNLICEVGLGESSGGRPPKILELNKEAGNLISLYLAPDYVEIILYDLHLNKIYKKKKDIWIHTKSKVLSLIKLLLSNTLNQTEKEVLGVGIAVNGLVDAQKGVSVYSPHYNWSNIDLKKFIKEEFSLRAYIENDVRAMAIGEKNYGMGKGVENFIVINIENGVGSALYLNGKIYRGSFNGAGEFGHIPIEGNEFRCSCGKRGCLETLVTNEQVELRFEEEFGEKIKAKEIYERYANDIGEGKEIVENISKNLGKGLVPLINILDPQRIILVGDINFGGDKLYKLVKKELCKRAFGNLGEKVEILPNSFGYEGANMGAISLVMENLFKF